MSAPAVELGVQAAAVPAEVLASGAQEVLADAAAVVDAVRQPVEPIMGPPNGDIEAAKVRARALNAGIAEQALVARARKAAAEAAAGHPEQKVPTAAELAVGRVRLAERRSEAAHLLGVLGLDGHPDVSVAAIAGHAHEQGVNTRIAVYSALARAGIGVEGLGALR